MRIRYICFIDDNDKELDRWDSDSSIFESELDFWDGCSPSKGDQVYFPNYGLYEVERIRANYTTPSTSVLEVKLSFIRSNL